MTESEAAHLPRLAIFHESASASLWEMAQTLRHDCRIVWVVGWSATPTSVSPRAYKRFGDVVDLEGLSHSQAVEAMAQANLDGVLVYSDRNIPLAAAVAAKVGLPFHSPETAELLNDKLAQRTALRAAGLPVPAFVALDAGDVRSDDVSFPAVLKPREGAASRDTFLVHDFEELTRLLATCNPAEKFILEEWLPDRATQEALCADLVSVESVVQDGRISHLAVTGRFPFALPFRETGMFLPSNIEPSEGADVCALAAAAADALGIRDGILHTEVKRTPAGPRLVEVNGRTGGGVASMTANVGGPSVLHLAIKVALGEDVGPVPTLPPTPIGFFRFLVGPEWATRVEKIEGADQLATLPGVEAVALNRHPGEALNARLGPYVDHVLRVDGWAPSHEALAELVHEAIPATVQVTYS